MVSLRAMQWPNDRAALCALDVSFTTDRIYQVIATERSFVLEEINVVPPLHKVYPFADDVDSLPSLAYVVVAEIVLTVVARGRTAGLNPGIVAPFWSICLLMQPIVGVGLGAP